MKIELEKELIYNSMLAHASTNDKALVKELEESVTKLIYPDYKTSDERLREKAKDTFKNGSSLKMRIKANTKTTIKDSNPLAKFGK